ncbi:TonB-dependent receptor [Sphingobium chlorophenolicum]|uniref:TonB-dependent receptor n=2 Tax=Sphingobium chlorophenolicum TaxID=46429 RepID=A0A081RDC1_SPHCR|nr:TonB-dependent receptor [Sphingobium chlorophenolicum]
MLRGNLYLAGISLPGLLMGLASPALAQDGVAEIIVTAQKRAENLQDVPIAVSAYSSEALEARGATGLTALFQSPPPGVVMQPFAGSQSMLIVDMRGVTNSDPGQGTVELGTAVYIDDVYLGRAQGMGAELVDPERIEVLRGPQGTLFGRNAEGGAIRIVTKKPTGIFGGDGKVTIGNFDQRRYEAHLNLPEIAGFSIKLDYLNSSHGGWTKNGPRVARIGRQDDFGAFDGEGYRGSVRWQPTSAITVDYAYDHSVTKDTRDYVVLVRPPLIDPNGRTILPLSTLTGARPLTDRLDERTDTAWTSLYNAPFRTEASGHTLQAGWELNDALTLRSITAFRKTEEEGANQLGGAFTLTKFPTARSASILFPRLGGTSLGIDPATPIWGISGVTSYNKVKQKQESQEFQLVGSLAEVEFVLGAYYFHEKVQDTRQTLLGIVYTDPAFTQALGVNPFAVGSAGAGLNSQTAESTSYAGFAQATWSPEFAGNRLHLTAGLRYTDDKKTFDRTMFNGAPTSVTGAPFREKRWDPAFTIAYDVADNVNVYGRYAQAYRAGGVSVRSPSFKPFGAEVNKSFEIGVKSDLIERRVRVNAALFENRIHNRQITSQLDPTGDPAVTDTLNASGVTRIRGGELEIVAAPTRGLQVSATYAYLHGKRPGSYFIIDPNAELRIQSLPEHAVTLAIDYSVPVGIGDLAFHADYAMASDTPGTGRVAFGAFAYDIRRDVANARIALQNVEVGPAKWRLALFAKNLFDTAYPVFTSPGANAVLSPPRSYGVELGTSF